MWEAHDHIFQVYVNFLKYLILFSFGKIPVFCGEVSIIHITWQPEFTTFFSKGETILLFFDVHILV